MNHSFGGGDENNFSSQFLEVSFMTHPARMCTGEVLFITHLIKSCNDESGFITHPTRDCITDLFKQFITHLIKLCVDDL